MIFIQVNISLFILTLNFQINSFQQIFENSETCEFPKKGSKDSLYLKSKAWQVHKTGRQMKNKVILISPCGLITPTFGCSHGTSACIVNTKNTGESVLNAGEFFEHDYDTEKDRDILRSVNGQPCSRTENFTTIIEFTCGPNTKDTPRFLFADECELRVEMLTPGCTPSCTTRKDGHLIDLRDLKKLGGLQVQNSIVTKSFELSFCGEANRCGTGISMCETTSAVIPIADTNTLSISYVDNKATNNLVLKGHHGSGRVRRDTEVHVKCNWNEKGVGNLKYVAPQVQGKTFKFEGESSLACIKMPMNCMVIDPLYTSFVYDLKSLNNPHGAWKVSNITSGIIYINMCGPLQLPFVNNICTAQSSQVCLNNNGKFFNLGSIPNHFHVTEDDTVKAFFTDGSTCATNSTKSYTTEIEFLCSGLEHGPVFQSEINCVYTINWKTPVACPKNIATQPNCLMSDLIGNINLRNIYQPTDTVHQLLPNAYLRYNLCGVLKSRCNNTNNTSVCYVKNGKEHVVGYTNNNLLHYNTLLSLNLIGDRCGNTRAKSETKVYFTCNYLAPINGNVEVKSMRDSCNFEIHIDTPLACVKSINTSCRLYTKDSVYDLTQLMRNSSNYIVHDPKDPNITYFLNICRSIVDTTDLFCPVNSGACAKNEVVPHMKHMYTSIGNIKETTRLVLENGNLVLPYAFGSFCRTESISYSTKILFECSNKMEEPQFLNKTACTYMFIWRTPYACSKKVFTVKTSRSIRNCIYKHPKNNQNIDLVGINKDLVLPSEAGEYIFNICEHNITYCSTKNGSKCEVVSSNGKILHESDQLYLQYILRNECDGDGQANIVRIQLECNRSNEAEVFDLIGISDCTMYIRLASSNICQNEIQLNSTTSGISSMTHSNPTSTSTTPSIPLAEKYMESFTDIKQMTAESTINLTILPLIESLNCSIVSAKGIFHLKNINFQNNSTTENNYSLTFGSRTPNCSGYICINGTEYLQRTDTCPIIIFSKVTPVIKLLFKSHLACNNGRVDIEVWLKCDSASKELPTIQESPCKVVILYPAQEACYLLESSTTASSSTGTAVSISLGIVMFLVMVLIIGLARRCTQNFKKTGPRNGYKSIKNKQFTPVYYKDSSL